MSAGVLFHCVVTHCVAGDATFSKHGERIYALADTDTRPAVQEIDLGKKTIRNIPLTQLEANDSLRGITCSEDRIFCTTKASLWSFDPKSESLTKIRDAPTGTSFWRVAFDPKAHATFVTTDDQENPLFMFRNEREWIPVRMRRHPYPSCPVFTVSGELFFAAYGDLWHGEIQTDTFDGEEHFSVAAYRYAPLATLETYRKSLSSLQILGEDSRAGEIAVSPDERRVHYLMHGKHWLVTNGKTEELHLTGK